MKKNLQPRTTQISTKWQRLVFNRSGVEPTKLNRKFLEKLWYLGYGHKDASEKMAQFEEVKA